MRSFASDNNSGIHPLILESVVNSNLDHCVGYGDDDYTREANKCFGSVFGEDITPFYVFNGTGANVIALQAATKTFNSIITAATGHINVDECGSPVKFTGCILKEISTSNGKLTPELIKSKLSGFGDQHHSQPKVIYISQTTEMGTVYTQQEIKEICNLAHEFDMYVHMDGSRLANACAYLGVGMRELTRDCGVDILSLGGTKNGMMMGECVISFKPKLTENLKYYRKQSAQLYSKMRYVSAQYIAYLKNNLWLENASHANNMAFLLANLIRDVPNVELTQKVESNSIFLTMPREMINKVRQNYFFYVWNEDKNEIRLVCSWDTKEEDVKNFISLLRSFVR